MKNKNIEKLIGDEKVIATLEPSKKGFRSDIVNSALCIVVSLVMLALLLSLYFVKHDSASQDFIILASLSAILFVLGVCWLVAIMLQFAQVGLALTETRVVGFGGFPIIKKIDAKIDAKTEFEIVENKKDSFFVRVAGVSVPNLQNALEFETEFRKIAGTELFKETKIVVETENEPENENEAND